ncbi:type II toxin-antitoxin system PrlF family antitoxin [Patescibacteria group bacterium]|nr:type II toxin-antitoxin system PrlF family antitoxin [Patescibacteria group bacterium]MBU1473064.1 type II toxin-antitoxin system PrlF family antitoxin [Patescibacteria group bacterium]MBU2460180.1 type II toxin-antitoxin system PrlF family antitoxin [Patescibacteria group bacterium]MBU2544496.1 type II toxin-antitoxin system PrlF family antitoxin [Patescibacteria group bacterium]
MTTITTKGQVTIPESVRRALDVSVGDKVAFVRVERASKEATIRIISTSVVDKLAGSLKNAVPYTPQAKVRKILARERAKRYT